MSDACFGLGDPPTRADPKMSHYQVLRGRRPLQRTPLRARPFHADSQGMSSQHIAGASVAFAILLGLSGCLKKASWLPNNHGGYTLTTQVQSADQAFVRFRRSAEELCGSGKRYALTTPVVTGRGWVFGPGAAGYQGGTITTMQTDLTCQ